MNHYMRVKRSLAFFKMVAVKRAGDDEGAEKLYGDYAKEVAASDLTDEQKQVMMDLMNNDIAHYGKYSE